MPSSSPCRRRTSCRPAMQPAKLPRSERRQSRVERKEYWSSPWLFGAFLLHPSPLVMMIGVGVGAFFDFTAGTVSRAPTWMNKAGIEWVYRLAQEPQRMWRRYVLGNPAFLWRVLRARHRAVARGRSVGCSSPELACCSCWSGSDRWLAPRLSGEPHRRNSRLSARGRAPGRRWLVRLQ